MKDILARVITSVVILCLIAFGCYKYGFHQGEKEWKEKAEAAVNDKKIAETVVVQQEVIKEVEKVVYRDKFIYKTQKEVEYVTQTLVSCPVSIDAVRLWNKTRDCALHPDQASCTVDGEVPGTSGTEGGTD